MDPTDKQDEYTNTSARIGRHGKTNSSGRVPVSRGRKLGKKEWFLVVVFALGVPLFIYNTVADKAAQRRAEIVAHTQQVQARIDKQIAEEARAKVARTERELAATKPSMSSEVSAEDIQGVCTALKIMGATTCTLKVNFLSPTYFDATLPGSSMDARNACSAITSLTRKHGSPFSGHGWLLKIFAPTGDGSRPIAVCDL